MIKRTIPECDCGSGLQGEQVLDGYGIFLFYGCENCTKHKLSRYRADIMEQYECDEPIEEE